MRGVATSLRIGVLVAAAVVVAAPAAQAAPVPSRLYACVTPKLRTLNLTTKDAACDAGQKKITWRVEGVRGKDGDKGDKGAPGTKGDKGDKGDRGDVGSQGAKGDTGAKGENGAAGATGSAGSADSAQDVLAKLLTVDGAGSGLDADLLGGLPAAQWQKRVSGTCAAGSFVQAVAADGTVTCDSIQAPLTLAGPSTGGALKVTMPNTSGSTAIDVDHDGVGPGVYADTVGGSAIWGRTGSISAAAVLGDSASGEVVVGRATGTICEQNIGKCNGIGAVVGRHDGQGGFGVRGFVTDPNGGIGVIGQSGLSGGTGTGVRAENVNAANTSNALEAVTNSSGGTALFAQGPVRAATFNGAVQINGDLTVTGTKSGFRIDDPRSPQQRTLTHTPVETDELTVTYSGNARTDAKGRATVPLPDYADALATDWRYQLTPMGQLGQAIVEREVRDGSFVVPTEHPRTKVSWTVIGSRHDPQAVERAIQPVAEKRGRERGRYLEPALYGQPESKSAAVQATPTTDAEDRAKLPSER